MIIVAFTPYSYLRHGGSITGYATSYRDGRSTMYAMIPEVCQAIIRVLQPRYAQLPTGTDWQVISEEFSTHWNLPNCIGALDGKHVRIKRPAKSGSLCFNYKSFFSTVLMGLADGHQRFIWVNVGDYGTNYNTL